MGEGLDVVFQAHHQGVLGLTGVAPLGGAQAVVLYHQVARVVTHDIVVGQARLGGVAGQLTAHGVHTGHGTGVGRKGLQ